MRFSFAVTLLLLIPGLLGAQTRDQATEREIEQLEHAYNEARLANDIAALNRMTTADYFAIGALGTTREVGNQRTEPVNVISTHVWVRQGTRWQLALMHSTYL